jgi:bifunctional DNA-binding transcriptional regulator/antitoxin component of YhaV-PrlF toxin-antitoxin module
MDRFAVQVVQRGLITLPKTLRDAHHIRTGDTMILLDLGGVFVLSPRASRVDALADGLADDWRERGETLEGMLQRLYQDGMHRD